jgi:hypothetical protein
MKNKFQKGEKISLKKRFQERQRLLKPFIKKYGKPVLVHSTLEYKTFIKILNEGKLKFPKKTSFYKENSFIEKMFGLDSGVFFSLGFVYATAYEFKYSFIFDLNLMKDLIYYKNSISYQCYKGVIDYWDKKDQGTIKKLSDKNKICKAVVNKYYTEEYNGKKKTMFDFWKCEKEVYDLIKKYPKKKELIKIIKKIEKKFISNYPASIRIAKKDCFTDKAPEIISKKEIDLSNNKNFLGFYIKGKISKEIMNLLKKKYPGKILFDGKRIKKIY